MALAPGAIAAIVICSFIAFVFLTIKCLSCCAIIVRQEKAVCIESMGRFKRVLPPGLHWLTPIVEHPRTLVWKKVTYDGSGQVRITDTSTPYIDMREDVFIMNNVDVFSQDHIALQVSCFIIFNIEDAYKCVYEIENLHGAIFNTAQSQLNEIFADIPFIHSLSAQKRINQAMKQKFSQTFANWGVRIHQLEILKIYPTQMIKTLENQMVQERTRRSDLIIADAEREAVRLESEGTKIVLQNRGIGEQEVIKKTSEGQAQAQMLQAEAEADALKKMQQQLEKDGVTYTDYVTTERYTRAVWGVGGRSTNRKITLPFIKKNVNGLLGKGGSNKPAGKGKYADLE
ncbi:SPFH_domain/Band 7 family protein [Hexamita inflata]|uniref:SPFH domain/Band 7 family protein n=1 Tax=Hexamita inflata TaxID=28002 RepID=A0AA86PZD2_9EUKA|nr:SPFH domain/Band 7 family protein [Hexamita inflata]CAI9948886.1 SPFH domain/Band 7 family protein [Hexamita inflata]